MNVCRQAASDGHGLFWEIHGADGDIRLSVSYGHTQMVPLSLKGGRSEEKMFGPSRRSSKQP
ncbi:MAG: hypothetical protein JO134_19015 [Xanthobacteraceae bacterium]|nr:hypothetical protein [Xanthobacteraceae bacterium]